VMCFRCVWDLGLTSFFLKAKANIEKYCEQLEMDILQQFDDAYRQGHKPLMNVGNIAHLLTTSTLAC
jgi:hypothetical protein